MEAIEATNGRTDADKNVCFPLRKRKRSYHFRDLPINETAAQLSQLGGCTDERHILLILAAIGIAVTIAPRTQLQVVE